MIQRQLKVRFTTRQAQQVSTWLWHLTGVWNWAIKKIEADSKDGIFYTPKAFHNLLANHGKKLDMPSHTLQGTLSTAHTAWQRCFKTLAKKPKLKGQRNKLTSIPFPDPLKAPEGNTIKVPGLGAVRFHAQVLPEGKIKCARLVQRASGWSLCLFIDANPPAIPHRGHGLVGIDPGFLSLVTLSTGEKVPHPQERKRTAHRLAQAQRGTRKRLAARLQERLANQRQERNHQLSHRLVADHSCVVWSKDRHTALARTFGKSVASAGHAQLRMMLAYKCTASGRQFTEVPSKFSTMTCSACGALTGPTGYAGLQVRHWRCSACGAEHDRDVNAAINTLVAGLGTSHERGREPASEIPRLEPWGGSSTDCSYRVAAHPMPQTAHGEQTTCTLSMSSKHGLDAGGVGKRRDSVPERWHVATGVPGRRTGYLHLPPPHPGHGDAPGKRSRRSPVRERPAGEETAWGQQGVRRCDGEAANVVPATSAPVSHIHRRCMAGHRTRGRWLAQDIQDPNGGFAGARGSLVSSGARQDPADA